MSDDTDDVEVEPTPYDTPSTKPDRPAEEDGQREGLMYLLADPDDGVMSLFSVGSDDWWAAATATRLLRRHLDEDTAPTAEEAAQVAAAMPTRDTIDAEIARCQAAGDTEGNEDLNDAQARRAVLLATQAAVEPDPTRRSELVEQAVTAAVEAHEDNEWRDGFDEKVEEATAKLQQYAENWLEYDRGSRQKILATLAEGPGGAVRRSELVEKSWTGWDHKQWDYLVDSGMLVTEDIDGQRHLRITDKGREYLAALSFTNGVMPPQSIMDTCSKCGHPIVKVIGLDDVDEDPCWCHPVDEGGRIAYYITCPKKPASPAPEPTTQALAEAAPAPTGPTSQPAPQPPAVTLPVAAATLEVTNPEQLLAVLQAKLERAGANAEVAAAAHERAQEELADTISLIGECRRNLLPERHEAAVAAMVDPGRQALEAADSNRSQADLTAIAALRAVKMATKHVELAAQGAAGTFYQGAA